MDVDRLPPPTEQDNTSRAAAGAMWLALLAMLLVFSGVVIVGVPLAVVALWLGIKAQRSRGRASGPAITAMVLGTLGVLIGVAGPAVHLALQVYGGRQMPELIAEHEESLRPELREAAEEVFPCEGRIDDVELQSLYTQWPDFGGRPALILEEATLAYVDVDVQSESYTVPMVGSAGTGWNVNGRDELAAACEDVARGGNDPSD